MVKAFGLLPEGRALKSGDVSLELQVMVRPYRLDFLVNKKLVVEIDGAAYHSSLEAIERDRKRDEYLTGKGYTVLRIPAKVVFNQPTEAVNRVRVALAKLRSPVETISSSPVTSAPEPFPGTPAVVTGGFREAITRLSGEVDVALSVSDAVREFRVSIGVQ